MKPVSLLSVVLLLPCMTETVISFSISTKNVRRRTTPSRPFLHTEVCLAHKNHHQQGSETPLPQPPTNGDIPLNLTVDNTFTSDSQNLQSAQVQYNTSTGIYKNQNDTKANEPVNPLKAPSLLPASSRKTSLEAAPSSSRFRNVFHDLTIAAVVGSVTGLLVALFKFSIQAVQSTLYGPSSLLELWPALIPAFGGLVVGFL